jgi:hypothetical protein
MISRARVHARARKGTAVQGLAVMSALCQKQTSVASFEDLVGTAEQ